MILCCWMKPLVVDEVDWLSSADVRPNVEQVVTKAKSRRDVCVCESRAER